MGDQATIPCNLCGNSEVEVMARRDREGKPLRTVLCLGCGLAWSDPRPIEARSYYEEEYRRDYKQVETPRLIHIYRAGRAALDRWEKIRPYVEPGARVLDAGSGGGEFVALLTRRGLPATGIEPNRSYAQYSIEEHGVDVRVGFVGDVEFEPGAFALVTLWHALEHVEDPAAVFRRVRDWLQGNGVLVVEVPNVEARCISPGNRFHRAHLYSFNAQTLAGLGRATGFRVEKRWLSEDGGNVTVVFRKSSEPAEDAALPGPENARRILNAVRRHTPLRHLLTPFPYVRPVQRFVGLLRERRAVRALTRGGEVLDGLYRE